MASLLKAQVSIFSAAILPNNRKNTMPSDHSQFHIRDTRTTHLQLLTLDVRQHTETSQYSQVYEVHFCMYYSRRWLQIHFVKKELFLTLVSQFLSVKWGNGALYYIGFRNY